MRLGVIPETPLEWIGLRLGRVPLPLFETHIAATLARALMAAVRLGIFESLSAGPRGVTEIALLCRTNPKATMLLLDALTTSRYLTFDGGQYALTRQSWTWMLRDSPQSIRDKILLQNTEWRWLAELEAFIASGQPLQFHSSMSGEERRLYHRSMRALAGIAGAEVARRIPMPPRAHRMLDIGGSHGHYSAELCRRFPDLRAEVLELPEAIEIAAPLLAAEGLGDRVVYRPGNILETDLGDNQFDLVLMSNVAHHLDEASNMDVARRVKRALRSNGVFVIQEPVYGTRNTDQTGALLALYFGLQSEKDVRTWTLHEMAGWQSRAGLRTRRPIKLTTAPGWVQQSASRGADE